MVMQAGSTTVLHLNAAHLTHFPFPIHLILPLFQKTSQTLLVTQSERPLHEYLQSCKTITTFITGMKQFKIAVGLPPGLYH